MYACVHVQTVRHGAAALVRVVMAPEREVDFVLQQQGLNVFTQGRGGGLSPGAVNIHGAMPREEQPRGGSAVDALQEAGQIVELSRPRREVMFGAHHDDGGCTVAEGIPRHVSSVICGKWHGEAVSIRHAALASRVAAREPDEDENK